MKSKPVKSHRFYIIDLLRFVAAFTVVIFHYAFRGAAADDMTTVSFDLLNPIARYGYLGFHLFFIISGFVIILSGYKKTASEFVISRMVRLYPAYWFSVTFTFLVILMMGAPRYHAEVLQYVANLTMLHGYFGVKSIDGVYWTLMVELKFYFLVFLLILSNQFKKLKYYLGVWAALSVILTKFNISYLSFFLFPEWSYYFIAGACFYLIYKEGAKPYYLILIFITYIMALYNASRGVAYMNSLYSCEFRLSIVAAIISLFYTVFFIVSTRGSSNVLKVLNNSRFMALGVLTYPLYLIHQNIGFIIFNYLNPFLNKYLILLSVVSAMLFTSYLIHHRVEKKYSSGLRNILNQMYASLHGFTSIRQR